MNLKMNNFFKSYLHMCYLLERTVHFGLKLYQSFKLSFMKRSKQAFIDKYILKISVIFLTKLLNRDVTKILSCRVNTTSRWGIKQLGISFGSIFLLFSNKSSQGPHSY